MADEGEKSGLSVAVAQALKSVPAEQQAEQLALLPVAIDDPETVVKGGPGRPRGSQNKRTSEMTDYLLANYTSPLVGLAEIINRPAVLLAAELKCDVADAFKFQMQAMVALAPYLHSKMPIAVDVRSKAITQLVIRSAGGGDLVDGDDKAMRLPPILASEESQ